MAAKKTTKAKAKPLSFIPCYSDCGSVSQLEAWGSRAYPTLDAAKKAIQEELHTDPSGDDEDASWVIVQIVEVGKTSNKVNWTGEKELDNY